MSQLLDNSKKMTKSREKKSKINFWLRIVSQQMTPKKLPKNPGKKNRKIIFGSELSKANNKETFRLHQKMTYNREKKNRKIFLGKNCLKRIMSYF